MLFFSFDAMSRAPHPPRRVRPRGGAPGASVASATRARAWPERARPGDALSARPVPAPRLRPSGPLAPWPARAGAAVSVLVDASRRFLPPF